MSFYYCADWVASPWLERLVVAETLMGVRILSILITGLSTGIGIVAYLYPFWLPAIEQTTQTGQTRSNDAPLILTLLIGLCLAVLLFEVQTLAVNTKLVALLGILVAINATLRFIEVAIPMPGGFSPIFFLIIATGYIFGGRFGFLFGVLTLLVSALITGGLGPWLPFQMFTAGWVGLSAPLCRATVWLFQGEGKWSEVAVLAAFGGFWGLAYGLIINIWFWPFASGSTSQYWQPGIGIFETLERYATFYIVTSLFWDLIRAIGNVLLITALGLPTLRILRRFQYRFNFTYQNLVDESAQPNQEIM